jgi:hypothetical protein
MKYLIMYIIGFSITCIILNFVKTTTVGSKLELSIILILRVVVLPFLLGFTALYLTGKL